MERWDRIGRGAAYGAALALTPYLLIKVSWVVGSLLGLLPMDDGFSVAGWVVLNLVTVGMAGIGILLALALVQPWGMRIPGWLVVFCGWAGSGFLVSVLPFVVFRALAGQEADDPGMPVWEGVLIECGFGGMGIGLAVALPAYLRRRWPAVFAGRVGDGPRAGAPWPAALAAAVGLVWLYWALGGTLGLAHPGARTPEWHGLTGLGALWALAAAAALHALSQSRPARLPRGLPVSLMWLGSGSLFTWSAWKLPFTLFQVLADNPTTAPPEIPAVSAALNTAATLAGAVMLLRLISLRPHHRAPARQPQEGQDVQQAGPVPPAAPRLSAPGACGERQ
ncbi:hypothetical protein AB0B01_04075 [Streptomyces sp. NPDC044571]|uniref:hypothetical protein n=1 Tax=Streptomyces sp. NPDC044571 TaxID=3155371 RepID=UPI0033F733D1